MCCLLAALLAGVAIWPSPASAQKADDPTPPSDEAPVSSSASSPVPSAISSPAPAAGLRSLRAASRRLADAPPSLWVDLEAGRYDDAIPQLLALERRWAMDATYNALLAEVALAAGRNAEATLALERLVLLEPRNAGAWLDLAVASLAMGDTDTARRALDTLDRDFTVPPGIRLVVVSLRSRMVASGAAPDRYWVRASLLFGRDSNANGGLLINSITVTPTATSIALPIDPAFRARPSNLWLATIDASGRWATGWGPIEGRVRFGEKLYISESDYNTRDLTVTLAGRIGSSGVAFWAGEWRRLDLGRGLLTLDIPRLAFTRELAPESVGCRPSVGVELEGRRYQEAQSIYDARIFWLGAGVRCPLWGGNLSTLARVGDDSGPPDRPGGDATRAELGVLWQGLLAPDLELTANAALSRSRDSEGYSPLLESGAARDVDRFTARAELAWRLSDRWYALAWAEHTRQTSNIPLFGLEQTVVMTGLRYQSW